MSNARVFYVYEGALYSGDNGTLPPKAREVVLREDFHTVCTELKAQLNAERDAHRIAGAACARLERELREAIKRCRWCDHTAAPDYWCRDCRQARAALQRTPERGAEPCRHEFERKSSMYYPCKHCGKNMLDLDPMPGRTLAGFFKHWEERVRSGKSSPIDRIEAAMLACYDKWLRAIDPQGVG